MSQKPAPAIHSIAVPHLTDTTSSLSCDHGEETSSLPSFKEWKNSAQRSWMERLMDMASGYVCSGAGSAEHWVRGDASMDDDAAAAFVVTPYAATKARRDFPALLEESSRLRGGPGSLEALRSLVERDTWSGALDSVTPEEYATLVAAFGSESDRPEAAAIVASALDGGRFTHEFVVAVLRTSSNSSTRAATITTLLPLCEDLDENADRIEAELTKHEIVCTRGAFSKQSGWTAATREEILKTKMLSDRLLKMKL